MLRSHTVTIGLIGLTVLSGFLFSSSFISADEVTDEVVIEVPISCTLSGTGMNSHDAEINNGQYNSAIGETTIKASCNDNEGFAVYAIGYTDNEDGKNVLTNASLGSTFDIVTGTGASGANSQWAMKLSTITSPTPAYPITIQNSFDSFHTVPTDYALVAKRTSATDIGLSAEGSAFKTTYQVYISQTQPSGLYSGQVKYTLVHPNDTDAPKKPTTIVFDANGSTFTGGATKNYMSYEATCTPYYIGTTPTILKTSNLANDGARINGAGYTDYEYILEKVPFLGADRIKVEIDYGLTADTAGITIAEGDWDGGWDNIPSVSYDIYSQNENISGTETFVLEGDAVTLLMSSWATPTANYDYGMYAKFYPIYDTEETGTEEAFNCELNTSSVSGTYSTPTNWYDWWYTDINNQHYDFANNSEIIDFVNNNDSLIGSTINIYRAMSVNEAYNHANKTMQNGYYNIQDLNNAVCGTIAIGQNGTTIDVRDNNTYMVAKLKDGHCWMLENLRLDPTNPTTASNMSEANTNAPAAAIYNFLNGGNSGNIDGWSSVAVADVDGTYNDTFESDTTKPRINNASIDTLVTGYGPASVNGQAKVGVYYNSCAATIGTYCYAYGNAPSSFTNTSYSLCPANWRLPTTGSEKGEFYQLYSHYDTTMDATDAASLQYNFSAALSGHYEYYYALNQNSWGDWLSSTTTSTGLSIGPNNIYILGPNYYYALEGGSGVTLRCIVNY